jgi:hypothetical protein
MIDSAGLPQFVREALEDDAGVIQSAEELDVDRSLSTLLEAAAVPPAAVAPAAVSPAAVPARSLTPPSAGPLERLEATVREPPHRYAPFFARAAELLDLSEDAVIEQLARLKEPDVWHFAGLPGIHDVVVRGGPRVQSAETLFVRFAPGVSFPRHRHVGLERVLVLEGNYKDSAGVVHRAGELREWAPETEHSFRVGPEPCIFASVVFGRRFRSWPLRALASVLGR